MGSFDHLSLLTIVGVDFDFDYVPHFCRHYGRFAIDRWEVILQTNEKKYCLIEEAKTFFSNAGRCNFHLWDGEFDSPSKIRRYNEILASVEGFVLYADIDEFHEWPEDPKKRVHQGIVLGRMIDRFAPGYVPKELEKERNIYEQFPMESAFTKEALNAYWWKPCLFPSSCRFVNSHDLEGVKYCFDNLINIHHFKWTRTTERKLQRRVQRYRELGLQWRESARALETIYSQKQELEL